MEIPGFNEEDIHSATIDVIDKIIRDETTFKVEKIKEWTDAIIKETLMELLKFEQKFKYILTCEINQRYGAGLYSYSSCFLNQQTDAVKQVKWESDAMICLVTIYALALEWCSNLGIKNWRKKNPNLQTVL